MDVATEHGPLPDEQPASGPLFYHWIVLINTALVAVIPLLLDQLIQGSS